MLKLDRFSCSLNIQLKWDPPVYEKKNIFPMILKINYIYISLDFMGIMF